MDKCKNWLCSHSSLCVCLIFVICIYALLQIKFELFFWLRYSDNAEPINDLILNLSYSYIAACIFYFLTVKLPYWDMKEKCKTSLKKKMRLIESNYKACAESVLPFPKNLPNDVSKEGLVSIFKAISYFELCRLHILGYKNSVIDYISIKHKENRNLAKDLLEYKAWLNSETIVEIEKIRNSDLSAIINSLNAPTLKDNMAKDEGCRKMLAEAVYDIWSVSKNLDV